MDDGGVKPPETVPLTLAFRNGTWSEFLFTKFEPTFAGDGSIAGVDWEQDPQTPGQEVLAWVDWGQVQMITSRALEKPQ